jgi:iron complex outermembrane recepter protein
MKKYTLTIAMLFFAAFSFAQESHPVKGTIENIKNEKLAFTSVTLNNAETDAYVIDLTTDENGNFNFENIADGKYNLVITEFGYAQYEQPIEVKDGLLDLGTIKLTENLNDKTVDLKGVFVRKETSQYRNEIDKRVVEVGNDLVSAGTDAAAVLNNIPSVSVDQQTGSLSLRGNENVKIYVDGKPSSLSAAQILKQIPSNQIQKIEIITNPSAKYEADGKSGIINIVLVKGQKKGYNIGLTTGYEQGKNSRFNSSINSNVNVGKFNLFGNLNYAYRPSQQNGITQNYNDQIDQLFKIDNTPKNLSYKVGFDWFINDKNALTVYTNQWNGRWDGTIDSEIVKNDFNKQNINNIKSKDITSDYSLNYKLDFDKEDHNIVLDAFYSTNKGRDNRDYLNTYPTDNYYEEFRKNNSTTTRINLDYTNKIADAGKIEAGLQFREETNKNGLQSTDIVTNNDLTFNPNVDFKFTRNFYSGYINYNQQFGKFGAQVGLRLEHVKDNANWLYSPNEVGALKKDYTDLFPSAFLTYNVTEKGQIALNYSRRIDRPGIYQLTPVPQFTTALISSVGNPNLKPEYTNSVELGYLHRLEKGTISGNLFYRRINDNIIQTFTKNPDVESAFYQFSTNYDNTNSYGAEASFNYKVTKWFSTYVAADFTSSLLKTRSLDYATGNVQNKEITANVFAARMNNTFNATKNLSVQLFGFYRGKSKNLQGEFLDMWKTDLGLKYSFMSGRASVTARMNDIFKTMKARIIMNDPYNGYARFNWESQTFYLGFNYNLGGKVRHRAEVQKNESSQKSGGIGL